MTIFGKTPIMDHNLPLDDTGHLNELPNHQTAMAVYLTVNDLHEVEELNTLLLAHEIPYEWEDPNVFDPAFTFDEIRKKYTLKLQRIDFQRVDQLRAVLTTEAVEQLGKDYYLYSFTDEELLEVIEKADEWNPFDVTMAQKLLQERGKGLTPEALALIHSQRIDALTEPDKSPSLLILIGYITAILGGVISIGIGWVLFSTKKNLPTGEAVYAYSANTRKHGKRILFLGILCFVLYFSWMLMLPYF